MRKWTLLVITAALLAGCGRNSARAAAAARVTAPAFINSMIMTAISDGDIAALAAKQGRLPETRELGDTVHRTSMAMRAEMTRIARQRNLSLPQGVYERKVALKDNLTILPGQVFDRGYTYSIVQEMDSLLAAFNAADALGDNDLRQFTQNYRGQIQEQRRTANRILDRLGGSPWPGVSP